MHFSLLPTGFDNVLTILEVCVSTKHVRSFSHFPDQTENKGLGCQRRKQHSCLWTNQRRMFFSRQASSSVKEKTGSAGKAVYVFDALPVLFHPLTSASTSALSLLLPLICISSSPSLLTPQILGSSSRPPPARLCDTLHLNCVRTHREKLVSQCDRSLQESKARTFARILQWKETASGESSEILWGVGLHAHFNVVA